MFPAGFLWFCRRVSGIGLRRCDLFFIEIQPTKHHGENTSNCSYKSKKVLLLFHTLGTVTDGASATIIFLGYQKQLKPWILIIWACHCQMGKQLWYVNIKLQLGSPPLALSNHTCVNLDWQQLDSLQVQLEFENISLSNALICTYPQADNSMMIITLYDYIKDALNCVFYLGMATFENLSVRLSWSALTDSGMKSKLDWIFRWIVWSHKVKSGLQ